MNKNQKVSMLLLASVLLGMALMAQTLPAKKEKSRPRIPAWVSDKGYWVLERNINNPGTHTVLFYDNNNKLMYSETISGVKLNPESRKTKMKLKKALENSAATWATGSPAASDPDKSQAFIKAEF